MVLNTPQMEAPNPQNIAHATACQEARRGQSSGWIATFRYTLATSNLAIKINVPQPRVIINSPMKALTETY